MVEEVFLINQLRCGGEVHANLMKSGSNHQNFNSREALSSSTGNVLDVKS